MSAQASQADRPVRCPVSRADWLDGAETKRWQPSAVSTPGTSSVAAHIEAGDAGGVPLLEHAFGELGRFGFPQWHGMLISTLSEAHRLAGKTAKAEPPAHLGIPRYVNRADRLARELALTSSADSGR